MLELEGSDAQPHTLRDLIAKHLREEIVTGVLPPNQILKDVELALRLGISTTPVREALSQLALERLIIMPANRPKRVAPLSKRHALEMYDVFRLLAAEAYRTGPPALPAEAIATMRRANDAFAAAVACGDRRTAIAASRAFHDRVIKAAGNGELRRVCARSFVWLERALYSTPDLPDLSQALATQNAIVAALERRDFETATAGLLGAAAFLADLLARLPEDPAPRSTTP